MRALSEAELLTWSEPVGWGEKDTVIGVVFVMEIDVNPDFVGSSVEFAVIVSLPEAGTVAGAVYNPEFETVPATADQKTPVL